MKVRVLSDYGKKYKLINNKSVEVGFMYNKDDILDVEYSEMVKDYYFIINSEYNRTALILKSECEKL